MKVKVAGTSFTESEEIVIIYWKDLDELKVYVNKEGNELNFPYTHRIAGAYLENLENLFEEYPDYISYIEDDLSIEVENFSLQHNNFLAFIDNGLTKLYFSTLSYEQLKKLLPEIKRGVLKGIRMDVQ